jgi:phage/plasmid-like protein (TIGR03299 family)
MAIDAVANEPRVAPWRNLVTDIPEGMKLREAIEQTDLAYEVGFSKLRMDNGVYVPDKRATIRTDNEQYLGTVGDRYTIIQNKDAFAFLENIVDSGEVKPLGAGYFKGGARPWLQARLPDDIVIAGDKHIPFIFCGTSHDGGLPLIIALSTIRVVCENTYAMNCKSPRKFIVRHLASASFRVAEARRVLELSYKYFEEYTVGAEQLASQPITDEAFREVVESLFRMPDPNHSTELERENVAKKRAQLMRVYTDSPLVPRGNKYGAMQAVTEWADHVKNGAKGDPRARAERKTEWVLLGDGIEFKDRAEQFIQAAR